MQATETEGVPWTVTPTNPVAEAKLRGELGVGPLLARLLCARGLAEPDAAVRFLNPDLDDLHDPKLLPDFGIARDTLLDARERKAQIFIHGDYDVDGVTSAALLTRFLEDIGCAVTSHVPHRQREGYGIHKMAVEAAREAEAQVFLTCDCGTAAIEQVDLAKSYGMQVIVTDHHAVGDSLPRAEAVMNPHREDSVYPFTELSGVGVAFKMCLGLTRELGYPDSGFIRAFADLAALGTIADVMPLRDENRIIAKHGLQILPNTKKAGLQALMRRIGMERGSAVRSWDVGFRLGPRLNAAGRVDDARTALDLLLTKDESLAAELAEQVEASNQARRMTQTKIIEEAEAMIDADPLGIGMFLVVASSGWHSGVVGIVAGRLVERHNRPVLVATIDENTGMCRGSARSVPGFNLAEAIHAFPDLMHGGGHAAAAGCSFAFEHLPAVRSALDSYARERLREEDLIPKFCADLSVDLEELTMDAVAELAALEPFGRENPEPLFVSPGATLISARPTRDGKHLQSTWRGSGENRLDAIGFNMGEESERLLPGHSYSLLFESKVEEWQGRRRVKLILRAYFPA